MRGWLWRKLGRGVPEEEIEREVEFHLEMRAREFEAEGMTAEAAHAAARESFGDVGRIRERLSVERRRRSSWRRSRETASSLLGDVTYAGRVLRRSPGFLLAVVGTLGVGVALVVVWAGLANAYLVRSLPFPDADRLVLLEGQGVPDWRDVPEVLERSVSWDLDGLSIVGDGRPQTVETSWVSAEFFALTGARPVLGRFFDATETGPGGRSVAVIGYHLWQERWGGDPGIIGRTFRAYSADRPEESEVFTIIGVMPRDFWFLNGSHEVLAPLRTSRPTYMASLREGVSREEAEAFLRREAEARDPEHADVKLIGAQESYTAQVRPLLVALGVAVFLVLGIAFGNASSLVLVRATARESEFAVRSAIGAGRGRIGRQLLVEGLLVAACAGTAGTLLAASSLSLVARTLPRIFGTPVPGGAGAVRFDFVALGAGLTACVLLGLLLAVIPLVRVWRPNLRSVLTENARGPGSARRQRLRSILVTGEIALSLSLMIGAGLFVRSALRMQQTPLGFEADGTVALSVSLRRSEYRDATERAALFARMRASIEDNVPGSRVAMMMWSPFSRSWVVPVETPEHPYSGDDGVLSFINTADDAAFDLLNIHLVQGRRFNAMDRAGSEPVAIVSSTLARRLWPDGDALGRKVRMKPFGNATMHDGNEGEWRTVVGIVDEVRKTMAGNNPSDLYYALDQVPPMNVDVLVRNVPASALESVREAIWRVNSELPLDGVRWLDDAVAAATLPSRFLAWLLSAFGVFAVVMAGVGIYGVVACAVNQSRRDVAIRMALGATDGRVVATFVRQSATLIGFGLVLGLAGGFAASRVLASQLHAISPGDPLTYASVALGLGLVTFLATWLPARQAARTDPMRALQS
jgi:putative ABC transport system permease protein